MAVFWNDPSYAHKPALTPKTGGAIAPTYIYIKYKLQGLSEMCGMGK